MSSLNLKEKGQLEKFLDMRSGYVSDFLGHEMSNITRFSDRTFGEFFVEVANIDIHQEKYLSSGPSKANKLREFWKLEPDYIVGTVILALIQRAESLASRPRTTPNPWDKGASPKADEYIALTPECKNIANRLLAGNVNLEHLKDAAVVFNAKYLAEQIQRMERAIESDPSLASVRQRSLLKPVAKLFLQNEESPLKVHQTFRS